MLQVIFFCSFKFFVVQSSKITKPLPLLDYWNWTAAMCLDVRTCTDTKSAQGALIITYQYTSTTEDFRYYVIWLPNLEWGINSESALCFQINVGYLFTPITV